MTPEEKQALREHMKKIGKKGGESTKKKHGSNHFKNLGRKGYKALAKSLVANEKKL